jgi:hypothetical protein
MKVLIDIDKELYKKVVEHTKKGYIGSDVWIAVANGTPIEIDKPNCVTCNHFGECKGCEKREEE